MQIKFSVGAKAARLIGRENIADVDGALVELIKNSYDADASCVWVNFSMPFPDVPDTIIIADLQKILSNADLVEVNTFYAENNKGKLELREDLTQEEKERLQDILFSYNSIIVLDNGTGMSEEIVKSAWMYIGTSNKEEMVVSPNGRIKTGAKGIGRFALDKLSRVSQMYTAEKGGKTALHWCVDWDQFATARLIDQVKAELTEEEESYEEIVKRLAKEEYSKLRKYDWNSGTAFVLKPTREAWNERLFKKVNTNLKSINPIGNVDKFDVIVHNDFFSQYNYKTEEVAISKDDYDYKITIEYNGDAEIIIKLLRNEINLSKRTTTIKNRITKEEKKCFLKDFWDRDAFKKVNHRKEDYDSEIVFHKNAFSLIKESKEHIREVGPFSAEFYFIRNGNNHSYQLMKKVNSRKRKELLDRFSGVKIYRDSFKVRPYGDIGDMYDWLGLGARGMKSHTGFTSGNWRVQPNQLIGVVNISREKNSLLEDMANREGIAPTNAYYTFIEILRECLKDFEADRQYVYREYDKWLKEEESSIKSTTDAIVEEAVNNIQKSKQSGEKEYKQEKRFTEEEYLSAVYDVMKESERELNSKQMLQILSSSGIILNTFFHEFNAINTQFHVRTSQLKSRINYLLEGREYTGLPAYDPYKYVEQTIERNDRLVAALLDVIMEGVKKANMVREEISLKILTEKILSQWALLLDRKYISVKFDAGNEEECKYNIAVVDWYIILNNFLLNSAWFLEKERNSSRYVKFYFEETAEVIYFTMENNGPILDEKYKDNTDRIFELGETSKGENGTGLGLWVVKETVERYGGEINVLDKNDGFGLRIALRK